MLNLETLLCLNIKIWYQKHISKKVRTGSRGSCLSLIWITSELCLQTVIFGCVPQPMQWCPLQNCICFQCSVVWEPKDHQDISSGSLNLLTIICIIYSEISKSAKNGYFAIVPKKQNLRNWNFGNAQTHRKTWPNTDTPWSVRTRFLV